MDSTIGNRGGIEGGGAVEEVYIHISIMNESAVDDTPFI
jgi:hypothetical protein